MKRMVDLHLHSSFSDGVYAPARLIELAETAGLEAVALADHDNIDGIEEAMAAGRLRQVEVLSAVELSVMWEDYEDIHLLGYCFDHRAPALREALREFRDYRESRNERIVQRINERLQQEGREPLDFGEIRRQAEGTLGRPHIGLQLVARGYVGSMEEAFQRYLVPCNMPKRFFPIEEAIDLIHRAGGMTSLAHPPYITSDRKDLQKLFDHFVSLGLDGIEAYSNRATNDEIDWFISQARRRDLAVTGGSDFHGTEGGELVIGGIRGNLRIPYRCVEEIRRKAENYH